MNLQQGVNILQQRTHNNVVGVQTDLPNSRQSTSRGRDIKVIEHAKDPIRVIKDEVNEIEGFQNVGKLKTKTNREMEVVNRVSDIQISARKIELE